MLSQVRPNIERLFFLLYDVGLLVLVIHCLYEKRCGIRVMDLLIFLSLCPCHVRMAEMTYPHC